MGFRPGPFGNGVHRLTATPYEERKSEVEVSPMPIWLINSSRIDPIHTKFVKFRVQGAVNDRIPIAFLTLG